jgi:hypothetical protein
VEFKGLIFYALFPQPTDRPSPPVGHCQHISIPISSGPVVSRSGSICLGEKRSSPLYFSENGRKCLYLVKLISFEWQLEIQSVLYEFLSEKCVDSEYDIHSTVCNSHNVVT